MLPEDPLFGGRVVSTQATHLLPTRLDMDQASRLSAPVTTVVVTGILALGWGWSGLCWIGATIWAIIALALWRQRLLAPLPIATR